MKKKVLLVLILLLVTTLQVVLSREDEKAVAPQGWSVLVGPPFHGTDFYAVVASNNHTNRELLDALAGGQVGPLYVGYVQSCCLEKLYNLSYRKQELSSRQLGNKARALGLPFLPLSSLIARPGTQTHEN